MKKIILIAPFEPIPKDQFNDADLVIQFPSTTREQPMVIYPEEKRGNASVNNIASLIFKIGVKK